MRKQSRILSLITSLTTLLIFIGTGFAQLISVKPHVGYARLSMDEVNSFSRSRVNSLMDLTQNQLPYPDDFDGNYSGGIEISYHLENHYHLIFGTYYFREKNNLDYRTGSGITGIHFQNNRINEMFEINLGIKYYLRYQSWRRVNVYISGLAGFAVSWAESRFIYSDNINQVNNIGEFSSSSITAYFAVGLSLKLIPALAIEPEIGYRFANMNQLDGRLQLYQNFDNDPGLFIDAVDSNYQTQASYNFSGFYGNVGVIFSFSVFN